jgi:hypothetical protein
MRRFADSFILPLRNPCSANPHLLRRAQARPVIPGVVEVGPVHQHRHPFGLGNLLEPSKDGLLAVIAAVRAIGGDDG